jgi:hypothetical protein
MAQGVDSEYNRSKEQPEERAVRNLYMEFLQDPGSGEFVHEPKVFHGCSLLSQTQQFQRASRELATRFIVLPRVFGV